MENKILNNEKMSKLMPWIDEWIMESQTSPLFTKKESEIFSIIHKNWNVKDRISLLDSLYEEYGDDVKNALGKLLKEKTVIDWKNIAGNKSSNSLESFIDTLWGPMAESGFEYSVDNREGNYSFECTKCPMADLATEIEGEKWIFELACKSDYYMVEGFNSDIDFKRDKTLVEGDRCCDHSYSIKKVI